MNEANPRARTSILGDEERDRSLLVAMLEAEGLSVSDAADGTQALELVRRRPPDIILRRRAAAHVEDMTPLRERMSQGDRDEARRREQLR